MAQDSSFTARDRAEAASVTARGDAHQFEIQLGHLCNNRCVFCSSGQLTALGHARALPIDPILAAVEEARAYGARRITFLGGEPTLHRGLPRALQRAVELGFEQIVIFTNGVMLPHPGFIDRIVALGKFEWRISIQGGDEDAHVAVTGRPDSFRRILVGLARLRALGQRVTANICVNERSYRSLPSLFDVVREHDIQQLHVDVVRPASTGDRTEHYLRDIMPRYRDLAPYLDRMLQRFDRELPGFDVNVGNLPFCTLPAWAHRIGHGGEETLTRACDTEGLEIAVDKYAWHRSQRVHPPGCAACVFRPQCTGVFREYLALYGDEELVPVTLEALRTLDPAQHAFTTLVQPLLAPVLAGEGLPAGWSLAAVEVDARARLVEVRCAATAGGGVTLRFTPRAAPAGAEAEAALVADHFRLAVAPSGAPAAAAVRALLAWCERHVRAAGVVLHRPLDLARIPVLHTRERQLQRGRARVAALLAALRAATAAGELEVQRVEHSADGSRCTATVRAGSGDPLEIVMVAALRGGRARVDVELRLPDGEAAPPEQAWVQSLVERLRAADRATASGPAAG